MKRRGRLTETDIEVWRAVAATILRRMPGARLPPQSETQKPDTLKQGAPEKGAPTQGTPKQGPLGPSNPRPAMPGWSPPPQARGPAPAGVERAVRKRLASGRQAIDASLDLHGYRQDEAHAQLIAFIARAHRDGLRLVLVVTGKGQGAGRMSAEGRGVLRRLVPLWLAESSLRSLVVGFGEAARSHGGEGALYIHLRRRERATRE